MKANELTVGPLYLKIASCKSKYIILQGGKWSSKTVNTLIHLAILGTQKPVTITVVGSTIPNLKKGALRDFKKHVACKVGIKEQIKDFNSTDRVYTFINGTIIEFTSYTTALEATSGKRDYIFFNEVNGIAYDIFYNAAISTDGQVLMDYNPVAPFFVHAKFIHAKEGEQFYGRFTRFITDHRHNPFLSQEKHDELESISDPEKFRVYARGLTGKVEGLIYKMTKISSIPEGLPFGFGIDFGYNHDKCAVVKVYYQGRKRYYHVLLYLSENQILDKIQKEFEKFKETQNYINLYNSGEHIAIDRLLKKNKINPTKYEYMANILFDNGATTSTMIWGDHDVTYKNALWKLKIPFRAARKGPNSVLPGINKVKDCDNYYFDSPDLEKELETYVWQTGIDTLTGNEITINVPIDGMPDDSLAAIRYFNYSFGMRHSEEAKE